MNLPHNSPMWLCMTTDDRWMRIITPNQSKIQSDNSRTNPLNRYRNTCWLTDPSHDLNSMSGRCHHHHKWVRSPTDQNSRTIRSVSREWWSALCSGVFGTPPVRSHYLCAGCLNRDVRLAGLHLKFWPQTRISSSCLDTVVGRAASQALVKGNCHSCYSFGLSPERGCHRWGRLG